MNELQSRRFGAALFGLALGVALAGGPTFAHAQSWVATHTKAHTTAASAGTDVGAMSENETLRIAVALKLRNRDALDARTSPKIRGVRIETMTPQEIEQIHLPTQEQAEQVANHLRQHGFRNVAIVAKRMLVEAEGTPGQIKSAFRTEMHAFNVNGRRAYANVSDVYVPDSLADIVLSVLSTQ